LAAFQPREVRCAIYTFIYLYINICIPAIVYLLIAILLVIFYVITGIKLLRRLKRSHKSGRKITNLKQVRIIRIYEFVLELFSHYLLQMTVRILVSMGFIAVIIIIGLVFTFPVAYTPIGKLFEQNHKKYYKIDLKIVIIVCGINIIPNYFFSQ